MLGKLAVVNDLSCELAENLCIQCSWNPPFSLTPIPQYNITINKKEDGLLQTNSTITTNITYCLHQYGQYNISVAASNTVGLGNVTYKSINLIPTGIMSVPVICTLLYVLDIIQDFTIKYFKEVDDSWNVTLNIEVCVKELMFSFFYYVHRMEPISIHLQLLLLYS